jgi:ABC-2 type transport system ATP-binding protein
LKRRGRIRDMLERFELWEARKRLAQDMSGGMQRRLQLACALVHAPEVVFVDEPTAGLDPVLRARIWHYLRQMRDQGVTIVLTTQYVDEAEHCDRVALLDKGRLVVVGSPQELRGHAVVGESLVVETGSLRQEDRELLRTLPHVLDVQGDGNGTVTLTVRDIGVAIPEVTSALQLRGVAIKAVHPRVADFDDVFMKLVGHHD